MHKTTLYQKTEWKNTTDFTKHFFKGLKSNISQKLNDYLFMTLLDVKESKMMIRNTEKVKESNSKDKEWL